MASGRADAERAVKLCGTVEPAAAERVLTAGALTATFQNGQLRWIKIGDVEIIRGIAFVVRDRNWNTCVPTISSLVVSESDGSLRVNFDARCSTVDGDFIWHGDFAISPDGVIQCVGRGSPASKGFRTCRTGFVVLHPLEGFVGKPAKIEHTDGRVAATRVANEIDPLQPWLDVRAISHVPRRSLRVSIRMGGDTWESEDHRNWTDASFKTYCRPLALPHPYAIGVDEEVHQTVTLTVTGTTPTKPARAHPTVSVRLGRTQGKVPKIGLSVLPEDATMAAGAAELVKKSGVGHLNCRIDLTRTSWKKTLAAYARLASASDIDVVLEVITGKGAPSEELRPVASELRKLKLTPAALVITPAADLISYPPGTPLPEGVPTWQAIAEAARACFPGIRLGGGMLSNFTELNRKRPQAKLFDFITHATAATVHAADDRSVMETLESIPHIIRSTRQMIGKRPYRIGPSHIGASFNPNSDGATPNPENRRVTMARSDPRHRALFGAAWHLGFIAEAAAGGLDAVTVAAPVGAFGVAYRKLGYAQPWFDDTAEAKVYPVFHVIKGLAGGSGGSCFVAQSSDTTRVRALAWRRNKETHLWVANLRAATISVKLADLPKGDATISILDENTFENAVTSPAFGDQGAPFRGKTVLLSAYAVAHLCIRSA